MPTFIQSITKAMVAVSTARIDVIVLAPMAGSGRLQSSTRHEDDRLLYFVFQPLGLSELQ